jgi:hypothetical protein
MVCSTKRKNILGLSTFVLDFAAEAEREGPTWSHQAFPVVVALVACFGEAANTRTRRKRSLGFTVTGSPTAATDYLRESDRCSSIQYTNNGTPEGFVDGRGPQDTPYRESEGITVGLWVL